MITTAYCAVPDRAEELQAELAARHGAWQQVAEGLYLAEGDAQPVAWAANTWFDVEQLSIASIGQAAALLRERGPYWGLRPGACRRRSHLIGEKLLRLRSGAMDFPPVRRLKPLGAYTLLDAQRMLCARRTSRPAPDGALCFRENHSDPPARAYLKCWEVLTLLGDRPGPGDRVLELGAAPGAWTWALAGLGAQVDSVDKAPLDPAVAALPGVEHRQCSAFGIEPAPYDWLFCDVICYPDRLVQLLARWRGSGCCSRFVITIKFQGSTDMEAVRRFQALPDTWLLHLHHNKHELTLLVHPGLHGSCVGPWPWLGE